MAVLALAQWFLQSSLSEHLPNLFGYGTVAVTPSRLPIDVSPTALLASVSSNSGAVAHTDELIDPPRSEAEHLRAVGRAGAGSFEAEPTPQLRANTEIYDDRGQEAGTRWGSELLDTQWSQEYERDLRETLSGLAHDSRVVDVSCHKTLCRVQVSFADEEDASWYADGTGGDSVTISTKVVDSRSWRFVEAYVVRPPGYIH